MDVWPTNITAPHQTAAARRWRRAATTTDVDGGHRLMQVIDSFLFLGPLPS